MSTEHEQLVQLLATLDERTKNLVIDVAEIRDYLQKQNGKVRANEQEITAIKVAMARHAGMHESTDAHTIEELDEVKKAAQRPLIKVVMLMAALQVAQFIYMIVRGSS
jgi:predicted  nucleic acid-binding Zn-ribbon protein